MLPPKKRLNSTELASQHLEDGIKKEDSIQLEQKVISGDFVSKNQQNRKISPLSVMQESLLIPKEMTLKDRLSFYARVTRQAPLLVRLGQDSILNGENSSKYWNKYTSLISQHLSSLIPTEQLDLAFHLSSGYVNNPESGSWFSTSVSYLQKQNSLKISCPSSIASVQGYTGLENTKTKSPKKFKTKPRNQTKKLTPNSVRKLRVFPCKELHKIWKQWLNAYRWIYNWTIAVLKSGSKSSTYDLQKQARECDKSDWVNSLPGHQLQEAVADAVDAYKQAIANKGYAKFKSCRQVRQVIKFKAGNFKKGTWYATKTKGTSFRSPQGFPDECSYGTQLVWLKGKWYGIFPEYIKPTTTYRNNVVAIDPGVRTFATCYDGYRIIEVGKNDIGKIQRLCSYLDKLMSRGDLSASKKQRRAMRKAAHNLRTRIQNLIKELHNQLASFLTDNYKLIYLPIFETSNMVLKSKRKLVKKTARNMLTWSHYKFQKHLIQMAQRKGVLVVLCNESYTSKTCPECGHIHDKLGGSKKFQCPNCGYTAPRDWNGARNIMIRALSATTIHINDAIQVLPASE